MRTMRAMAAWGVLALLCGCEPMADGRLPSASDPVAADEAPASTDAPRAPEAAEAPSRLVPFATSAAPSPARCEIAGWVAQDDVLVYAAGAYAGRALDHPIDQSGHQATQIDVAVDEPSAPVVLMLGAYEPTVWNIGWSTRSRIVAVLVSGYHRQVIAGLPPTVPRLISTYENEGPCGYFHVGEDNLGALNPIARRVFGRPVARAFIARDGSVAVGTGESVGLVTDANQSPDQFRDVNAPLAGEAGLREAVAKGLLREARPGDLEAWAAAYDDVQGRDVPQVSGASAGSGRTLWRHNAYVVLGEMQVPAGLFGAHAATFIVPRGVPRPTGALGHSKVLDHNTMTCAGLTCGME